MPFQIHLWDKPLKQQFRSIDVTDAPLDHRLCVKGQAVVGEPACVCSTLPITRIEIERWRGCWRARQIWRLGAFTTSKSYYFPVLCCTYFSLKCFSPSLRLATQTQTVIIFRSKETHASGIRYQFVKNTIIPECLIWDANILIPIKN